MTNRRWMWLLALTPACLGGGGGGGGGVGAEAAAVSNALTESVDFDGGSVQDGDVPDATDETLTLSPVGGAIILSPGQANVIMPVEVDNADEDSDPIVATLIQFKGAGKHIEVDTLRRMEGATQGRTRIENSFSVAADVCDDLCNKEFSIEVTETSRLQSGRIGKHGSRTLRLDCSEAGDPSKCSGTGTVAGDRPSVAAGEAGEAGARYFALFDRMMTAECECAGTCAQVAEVLDGFEPCLTSAFDNAAAEDPALISCALDTFEVDVECFERSSCDEAAYDACLLASEGGADIDAVCGTAPASLESDLESCGFDIGMSSGTSEPATGYPCDNGETIDVSQLCDGTDDCSDGSDESICGGVALETWTCDDGSTIPLTGYCNGVSECRDGSDESGCDGGGVDGPSNLEFDCLDGLSVPSNWVCDGFDDCTSGIDEANCLGDDMFVCASAVLLSIQVCDGTEDCAQGEDEAQCVAAP